MQAIQGGWVEIHKVVLPAGQRASQVPVDTQAVPLEMRTKGFAMQEGSIGDTMAIRTLSGRIMQGTLIAVNPSYTHGYGSPIPELLLVGLELKALLEEES
jgi:2-amino-4-ketopentanoate thiolase alpha subunit